RGKKVPEKATQKRKNFSLISACPVQEVVASRKNYGTVDGVTLEAFIVKNLVHHFWKGACVVMDNAKFYQGEMVRKSLEPAWARLIYLPPYSPEFSPRENFGSKLKAIFKKVKARSYKNLVDGITEARSKVTNSEVRYWSTHCCYCTS
ncbi:MAG: IS630 family transposase, partial [Cyanobacteria bacterium QS_6_48_18]